jgi:GH24 family phage-related lysozyme (muramidase)
MYPSVRQQFIPFSKQFEGRMPVMYLDTHAPPLVTVGVGNLIDPIEEALKLPFEWKEASPPRPATAAEIEDEWSHVKSLTNLSERSSTVWNTVTRLFLSDSAIDVLIGQRLIQNEAILKRRWSFVNYETWPADAQLALLSMTWAMGPGFNFPAFEASCAKRDFASAASQSHMADANNPGLTPRNRANYQMFINADRVVKNARGNLTASTVYFPQIL